MPLLKPGWILAACLILSGSLLLSTVRSLAAETAGIARAPAGWRAAAPRDEIRPAFSFEPSGGPDSKGAFVIATDDRRGLAGDWAETVPVTGGHFYHFSVWRKTSGDPCPRRDSIVRILWLNARGRTPKPHPIAPVSYAPPESEFAQIEPEYPTASDRISGDWNELAGTYQAPPDAVQAVIELHHRWAPRARVEWSIPSLAETAAPAPRIVHLATVHYRPHGGRTVADNRRQFAPLIADAARQGADLIVLPEALTRYDNGVNLRNSTEPIPGPSTDYFGGLARRAHAYIVAGLIERDGPLIYNTAALIGPDGALVGKYRKTVLTRSEVDAGFTPGEPDYPVFSTPIGKIGLMICYEGFFPEVARQLADNGAEIIAWPVAGCDPLLAAARACENRVYVVSSTYTDVSLHWMISAIFDPQGRVMAQARTFGSVAVATVDLNRRFDRFNLGDFKSEMAGSRPIWVERADALR